MAIRADRRCFLLGTSIALLSVSCTLDTQGTGQLPSEGGVTGGFGGTGAGGFPVTGGSAGGGGSGGVGGTSGGGTAGDAGLDAASGSAGQADAGDSSITCADDPCGENALCDESDGAVSCSCLDGFEPGSSGCVDIDECKNNLHDCHTDALCTNLPGSFDCTCHHGLVGDGKACRYPLSCKDLAASLSGLLDGQYVIDPDGEGGPVGLQPVFCDMTSDGGVGYTMVKYEDPTLLDHQDAYRKVCAVHGLDLIVPRTRAHAKAIVAWLGMPPNLVGVYPKKDNDSGLDKFQGRCQGAPCSFYMSDTNSSDCETFQPSGNSKKAHGLIRWGNVGACGFWGRWDDNDHHVVETGWVVCSTNDAGPVQPRKSCQAYNATESVWNQAEQGISGLYAVDPDGDGPRPTMNLLCDQRQQGGGWSLAFVVNSKYSGRFDEFCASDENLPDLTRWPDFVSAENTARRGWIDLNDFAFDGMRLAAYDNGAETFSSQVVARADLRIPFGASGYFLFGDSNGYTWCAGAKSFTDDGLGQVDPPANAPDDCKGHINLGSGWDFSTSMEANKGLTLSGNDGASWMSANNEGKAISYGTKGAAQAIWVR